MNNIKWLLEGSDPSLIYQVKRDLLKISDEELLELREKIAHNGYGLELLKRRKNNGHWGNNVYNPKWTCTHYVLFELKQLGIDPSNFKCRESATMLLDYPQGKDGGINYARTIDYSDVCINGMILSIVCYFNIKSSEINKIVDYLLKIQMKDGGWNCSYFKAAHHSSLHTTISVLEGIEEYKRNGYIYKLQELRDAKQKAIEFILKHRLFKRETNGEIIHKDFFRFTFPIRWKYDILRCLDYMQNSGINFDDRMSDALDFIEKAQDVNHRWKAFSQKGKTYFEIEQNGKDSKWNTLRALRVLIYFKRIKKIQ